MTLDDFLKELEEVSKEATWTLWVGRFVRIQSPQAMRHCCPIAAVAHYRHFIEMENDEVTERAHEIGLSYEDAVKIMSAADRSELFYPEIRSKLLTACKLTESAS